MPIMTKMYINEDGVVIIRQMRGVYMVVDANMGQNKGWWYGNAKAEGYKFVAEVPVGIAGGAMSDIPFENLLTIRAELFAHAMKK